MKDGELNSSIGWGIILSIISIISIDFLFHAGIFVSFYQDPQPPLLSGKEAFIRIPIGYFSFLILDLFLLLLIMKFSVKGILDGFKFGFLYGAVISSGFLFGLYSIIDVELDFLAIWFIGQTTESGFAGSTLGWINEGEEPRRIGKYVTTLLFVCVFSGIVLQNILV